VAVARDSDGPPAAVDRFRELHIGQEAVVRLPAREPGAPFLNTPEESSCGSAISSSQIAWLKEAFNLTALERQLERLAAISHRWAEMKGIP
jgi:hypothetical protein